MKRIAMLAIMVGVTLTMQAQKEAPKPNTNKAVSLARQGKFDEAKTIADGIPTHEKTMNDAKAWFVRGIVYASMDTSKKYTGSATDNAKNAGEAFNKAFQLAGPKAVSLSVVDNGTNLTLIDAQDRFYRTFLIAGDKYFREEKFGDAVNQFEKGIAIKEDTAIFQYAGYASYNGENIDKAIYYIGKYIENGGKNAQASFLLVGALYEYKKDYEKAVLEARRALKNYPNDVKLRQIELNSLIKLNRYEEATEVLKNSLKADPKDVESHYLMARLYDELKRKDEAKQYYELTVKLNPKHVEAQIALAKMEDEAGYKKTKLEMDKLNYNKKEDKAKLEVLDKEYLQKMGESTGRWENIAKIEPNNIETLYQLYFLYGQLEMKDKLNATISRLKALGESVD